jgi:hypothetical protein
MFRARNCTIEDTLLHIFFNSIQIDASPITTPITTPTDIEIINSIVIMLNAPASSVPVHLSVQQSTFIPIGTHPLHPVPEVAQAAEVSGS